MNIYKFLKPVLPAVMLLSAAGFIAGCSSSSDDTSSGDTPAAPAVPLVGITGIWTGSFTWETNAQSKNYDVTMLFYTPDGEERGSTGGFAFGKSPDDTDVPHFLFEGGYEYFTDPIESDPLKDNSTVACEGDVWAVGRFGTQGTFVQEFSYTTGSAAGPDQRGGGCLYLSDADDDGYVNDLTGEIQFEEGGKFNVTLTYSEDNTRDMTLYDLGILASDKGTVDVEYHLWSNDNSGNYMSYAAPSEPPLPDFTYLQVVENRNDDIDCGGLLQINQVAGQTNLFTVKTPELGKIDGCTVLPAGTPMPEYGTSAQVVDLPYSGLGAFYDYDKDGNLEFTYVMASKGSGEGYTAQALYNQFLILQQIVPQ
jgi:hypothetical protein